MVAPPADRPELEPATARRVMANVVYLPCYPEMPEIERERLAREVLRGVAVEAEQIRDDGR